MVNMYTSPIDIAGLVRLKEKMRSSTPLEKG